MTARPAGRADGLLESFLPGDRRRALAAGRAIPDRMTGAGLFADISGFTALAEALVAEHGRQLGAEALGSHLDQVYQALGEVLFGRGGEILYFSGDAITCWLDGDDGARAVQCALEMQDAMSSFGEIAVPGGSIALSLKVAVAVGPARRVVVGDPEYQLMDVLGGRLIDWLASAEGVAERGEVVADQSALEVLSERLACRELRTGETGRRCGVVQALLDPPSPEPAAALVEVPVEVVRPWILPELFDRLVVGAGLFLSELRRAHPIFVRFGGFEFDDDPDVATGLDGFVREVQRVLGRFDGTLLGITVGDKGAYLNAVVGAPRSHEDDAHRAVAAAVQIRDLESRVAATDLQVGVSVGEIYSATYGHRDRRTYSVLGDPTNLAARLMSKAPPGEVYVLAEVADAVEDRFTWVDVAPLTLKGKSQPVRVRIPVIARPRPVQRVRRYPLPIVGRDRELAQAYEHVRASVAGERRVLAIAAEPGMGKSRFVAELLREAEQRGLTVTHGQAESIGASTSYGVWREVWRRLLAADEDRAGAELARDLERVLATIDPALAPRAPLLAPVIGVDLPDNEFVAQFDAKLRKASLESLLGDVLVARTQATPLVVVLEDMQWADPLSLDLLSALVRRASEVGVLFLLSYRREPGQLRPPLVDELPSFAEIALTEIDAEAMRSLVDATVHQAYGPDTEPAGSVADLVLDRAQGNPFYAEELIRYLHRLSVDVTDASVADAIDVPENLNTIVLSRIDGLAERPRQALKVASVVGREFRAPLLGRIHGDLGADDEVVGHLDVARGVQLVVPLKADLIDWQFRHSITQDVAYASLPRSVRRRLHERTGDILVEEWGMAAVPDIVAHHFWHSDNVDKQRRALRVAGDAARDTYANAIAIEHFRRLAEVTEGSERAQALLDQAAVLELTGDWAGAEQTAARARELSVAEGDTGRVGWCDVALAETARKHGRYDDAVALLDRAAESFTAMIDDAGLARVLHLQGTIAAQHNDLAAARRFYEASRQRRERLGDRSGLAALLSNLGVVAEYEGDYRSAAEHHEQALALRRELGDRWAIAVSHTNLGMIAVHQGRYADARDLFDESMRLNQAVGDNWMVAIAHHNLGNANRGLGEGLTARRHYATSLASYREYDDRWALAFLLEDIAVLAAADEAVLALELLGAADALRAEIDAVRPAALDAQLGAALEEHVGGLPAAERTAALERGRARSTADALDLAVAYCEPATAT